MRHKLNTVTLVLVALAVAVLSGCGIGGKTGMISAGGAGEDFDPFQYGDEFVDLKQAVPDTRPSPETILPADRPDAAAEMDVSETEGGTAETPSTVSETPAHVYGYRIQIGIDQNKERMEALMQRARSRIDLDVYLEFEAPFYRVRIGNFKTRKEAEQYVKELKDKGFRDSLWVMSEIEAK